MYGCGNKGDIFMVWKIICELYGVVFKDKLSFKDIYGGEVGFVFVECMCIWFDVEIELKIVFVFFYFIGGLSFLLVMGVLVEVGYYVICVNMCYRGNDIVLMMEKCVVDLGVVIKDFKIWFGYECVVLGGWSGGGFLFFFY